MRKNENERDNHLGEVIDRRVQVYGNPVETFARIAEVWSGILGHHINPVEVPLMMAGMKMVRAQVMPDYSDNSDDIDGYLDIFRQLVGEDMIHARTVNEFIEKKWGSHQDRVRPPVTECLHWGHHLQETDHSEADCPAAGEQAQREKVTQPYGWAGTDDKPIPYQVVDGFDCVAQGEHDDTARHARDECPATQP